MALIRRWLPHDIIAAELLNELPQDILSDFVKNGYTISAGTGLQAVVAAGVAYISDGSQRFRVEHDAQNTLSLTASSTNHVFLNQDGTFTVNTTGTPPSNSIKLGRAVTDASSVTATYDDRPLKPITQNEIRDGSIANAQVADAAAIAQSKLSLNADPGAHQTRHQPSGADALPWGSGGGLDADKLDGKHDSDLQPLAETIHLDASRSTQGWGEVATVQPTQGYYWVIGAIWLKKVQGGSLDAVKVRVYHDGSSDSDSLSGTSPTETLAKFTTTYTGKKVNKLGLWCYLDTTPGTVQGQLWAHVIMAKT